MSEEIELSQIIIQGGKPPLHHSVDYTDNKYITVKTQLEEGIYTFQVKVEKEGLVLDVFLHVGDEDEHVITKTAWYEDLGLRPTDLMDKLVKRYIPT